MLSPFPARQSATPDISVLLLRVLNVVLRHGAEDHLRRNIEEAVEDVGQAGVSEGELGAGAGGGPGVDSAVQHRHDGRDDGCTNRSGSVARGKSLSLRKQARSLAGLLTAEVCDHGGVFAVPDAGCGCVLRALSAQVHVAAPAHTSEEKPSEH